MSNIDKIRSLLVPKEDKQPKSVGLSSGSSTLNLACSGKITQCFLPGHFYNFVGDSGAGKTFLTLTALAEAANSKRFADYRLIYDPTEDGALMDLEKFFGKTLKDKIEGPAKGKVCSETLEDFYFNVDDAAAAGKPFVYVLDSMDALIPKADKVKFRKTKSASRSGKEESGSYGTAKAKLNSEGIRVALSNIKATGSILIVISQAKMNINSFGFGNNKTRAGGLALTYYATDVVWFTIKKKLRKKVAGKMEQYGTILQARVSKNRQTGREPSVDIVFYPSVGVDDTGGCVRFLMEREHWKKKTGGIINATDLGLQMKEEELIRHIEDNNLERKMRQVVSSVWTEIENKCKVERKKRYE